MSWNVCGTRAATKTSEPGPTGRCSSPTVIVACPGDDEIQLVLAVGLLRIGVPGLEHVQARR